MADTCYHRGMKVILVSHQNACGKWACHFTIPELKARGTGMHEGLLPKEYETEQEAEMAAFEHSKKILDSVGRDTTEN